VDAPATSNRPRDFTVKSCVGFSQMTFGLSLEQVVLRPQIGGAVEPEVVSPKAEIVVAT
jgi:hypothetical protein